MPINFKDVTNQWYAKMRVPFMTSLTKRFPDLTLADAENIYQDTFLAIYDNIEAGRIKDGTSWYTYIMTIGYNIACKFMRHTGKTDSYDIPADTGENNATLDRIRTIEKQMQEEDLTIFDNPQADAVLAEELTRAPEPCATIIRLFYYERLSLAEIADAIGFNSARSVQSRRWQCVKNLISPVKAALQRAGIID